jgi:hypothetical protein
MTPEEQRLRAMDDEMLRKYPPKRVAPACRSQPTQQDKNGRRNVYGRKVEDKVGGAIAKAAAYLVVLGALAGIGYAMREPLLHMAIALLELISGAVESIASMSLMGWLIVVVILGVLGIISVVTRVAEISAVGTRAILKKLEEIEGQMEKMAKQLQADMDDNPKFPAEMWQTGTRVIAEDEARLAELTAAGVTSGPEFTALSKSAKFRKEQPITEQEFLLKTIANRVAQQEAQ